MTMNFPKCHAWYSIVVMESTVFISEILETCVRPLECREYRREHASNVQVFLSGHPEG